MPTLRGHSATMSTGLELFGAEVELGMPASVQQEMAQILADVEGTDIVSSPQS